MVRKGISWRDFSAHRPADSMAKGARHSAPQSQILAAHYYLSFRDAMKILTEYRSPLLIVRTINPVAVLIRSGGITEVVNRHLIYGETMVYTTTKVLTSMNLASLCAVISLPEMGRKSSWKPRREGRNCSRPARDKPKEDSMRRRAEACMRVKDWRQLFIRPQQGALLKRFMVFADRKNSAGRSSAALLCMWQRKDSE